MPPNEAPPNQTNRPNQAPAPSPPTSTPPTPSEPSTPSQSLGDRIYPTPVQHQAPLTRDEAEKLSNQSDKKKRWLKRGLIGLVSAVVIGTIFYFLWMSGLLPFNQLKTITYENAKGQKYSLKFYARHTTKTTKTGTKQLVSEVSRNGKLPLTISISNNEISSSFERFKDCKTSRKVLEVQNDSINDTISVCDFLRGEVSGQKASDNIYVAVFKHEGEMHTMTISQDLSKVNLSSPAKAKESLERFGLTEYHGGIKIIVASIKPE